MNPGKNKVSLYQQVYLAVMLCCLVIASQTCRAQSASTIVEVNPDSVSPGQTVGISGIFNVDDPGYQALLTTNVSGQCTAAGYPNVTVTTTFTGGSAAQGYYQITFEGSLTANQTLGQVTVTCTLTGTLNGGQTVSDSDSGVFTIVACSGDADYNQTSSQIMGATVNVTWALQAINLVPKTLTPATDTAYGVGISGNVQQTPYINDCDGGTNDNIPEVDPDIEDGGQEYTGSSIIFNFVIFNYNYAEDNCTSCSFNPNGVENVRAAPPTTDSKSLTQSCY